jgi:membrane protease YdiL (CAAX protease family)
LTKKVKAAVLLSALWVFGWFVFLVAVGALQGTGSSVDWAILIAIVFTPLILGWGLWWVLKKD